MAENVYYINPAWIESAKQDLTDEEMREYYYWLIECRMFERDLDECSDRFIKAALRDVLRQANTVHESYTSQTQEKKKGGRAPNPNTDKIYEMRKQGMSATDIALELNMKDKTVYSNPGWKKAQEEFKNPVIEDEQSSENSGFSF